MTTETAACRYCGNVLEIARMVRLVGEEHEYACMGCARFLPEAKERTRQ